MRRGKVRRVFIPPAGAHLLDRPAQFVVEGATCPGIVAQTAEVISDTLGFGFRGVRAVALHSVRCGRGLMGIRRTAPCEEIRAGRRYSRWLRDAGFFPFCLRLEDG